MDKSKKQVTNNELLEFIKENVATKEDLESFATKEDLESFATKEDLKATENKILHNLDGISKQLVDLQTENAANIAAHKRFEHRDEVFAEKLEVNLNAVDADG